jgi:hypothetical protein
LSPRQAVAVTAGCLALAVAVWLIPASIHVVQWGAPGPSRVALFASRAWLLVLVLSALAASALVLAWGRRGARGLLSAGIASDICLLWLWALPYLPWLPDRLPVLLILAGPARWAVVVVAALAVLRRLAAKLYPAVEWLGTRTALFAVALVCYSAFGLLNARELGPGGDEPHYLIISQSLIKDGDLKIENNYRQRDYREYWGGDLRPDYMKRGTDGEIYSIHAPGLPVLLLPVYAIGGYLGSILVLSVLAALTTRAVFDLTAELTSQRVALVATLAVCFTVPFVPHAWLIFPEIPGALAVAWAAWWVWKPVDHRTLTWAWRGVCLALLPWLHTKFVIFIPLFGGALMWRLRSQPRLAAAFLAPIAASLAAWLGFFYIYYGTANPEAPYGSYTATFVLAKNIPRGLLGLMFDQKFGLLPYAPVYFFAIAGCWLMLKRSDTRFLGALLLLVTAVHVGSTTRLYMWWGGTSAPARFLVPILPCLAPMIALSAASLKSRAARVIFASLLSLSLLLAALGAGWPARLFLSSDSRGYARLLETIQNGAPLTYLLPTFTYEDWVSPIRDLIPWLGAGCAGALVMMLAARWLKLSAAWLSAIGALVMLMAGGGFSGRLDAAAREEMARRGALDLIWHADDSLRPFEYTSFARIDETRLRTLATVTSRSYPPPAFALPEGRYEARVWFGGSLERLGSVAVSSSGRVTFAKTEGTLANPAIVPFELPAATGRLSVAVADEAVAASVSRVEIVPTVLVSTGEREKRPARRIEAVPDRAGAYLIYVDDNTFPEGGVFWTRGTQEAEVLLAPGTLSRVAVTLHLGPHAGDVRLTVAGKSQTVAVEANGTAEVQIDLPHDQRLVPIRIQSPTSFRPSEVNPASDDARLLGCQVRIGVD